MELVVYAKSVVERLPRGYGFLADQLRRAATSVALNYAEGCGKQHLKDRRRFFIQARGSANEVVAIADVAKGFGVIESVLHSEMKECADHLAAMLSRFRLVFRPFFSVRFGS